MTTFRFRPQLNELDDRSLPSVTPNQVMNAIAFTDSTTQGLREVISTLSIPRTAMDIQNIGTKFRFASDVSKTDVGILAEYLNQLQTQIAANPALSSTLGPLAGQVAMAEFQATVNAAYADWIATGFGKPPPVPPPPPVEDSTPDFGTGAKGNLPFSLTDPAWQTQSGGLRTWDVTAGSGTAIQTGDKFTAKYTGYLPDGTIFDSSDKSGNLSTTLDSSHLIPGFAQGLVGMKPGGVRRLDIPANLAYGANPPPGSSIPPNSELIFEVTLISSP